MAAWVGGSTPTSSSALLPRRAFTPPGSSCSIHFGKGLTAATPGSAKGLFLVVSDIEATRDALVSRQVGVSEVFHRGVGEAPKPGRDPERRSYTSFATFHDPDGNEWLLQEVTARLPGRVGAAQTTFTSAAEFAAALRRAEAHMAITRSASAGATKPGPTGMPSTSCASRQARR